IYQLPGDGVYPKVETFQRVCAQQHEVARLSEHNVVSGSIASYMDKHRADPTLENRPVGLPEARLFVPLDPERVQRRGWHPRQFGTGVHQHGRERSSLARMGGV